MAELDRLVRDAVADYDERSLHGSLPALANLEDAVKSVKDAVAGFGPLQPYFDDPMSRRSGSTSRPRCSSPAAAPPSSRPRCSPPTQSATSWNGCSRPVGRRVDLSSPFVDAVLPDGSRLHVVIPDITRAHWSVNIRKFVVRASHLDDLVGLGTLTSHAARFLGAAVASGLNILVAGGTQAGK